MTLILNNAEIIDLLPVKDCLAQLDQTYREMGLGKADLLDDPGPIVLDGFRADAQLLAGFVGRSRQARHV